MTEIFLIFCLFSAVWFPFGKNLIVINGGEKICLRCFAHIVSCNLTAENKQKSKNTSVQEMILHHLFGEIG